MKRTARKRSFGAGARESRGALQKARKESHWLLAAGRIFFRKLCE
ncbi:MAG: hypothetical protein Q4C50_00525 [Eubacteriales bacterium]|nr:hypothetical protein [Eubacteriales bacterium]MDO4343262.1 hypothetical protein [Eubacteriales bacterium]